MSNFYKFLEIFVKKSPAIWLWYRMLSEERTVGGTVEHSAACTHEASGQ